MERLDKVLQNFATVNQELKTFDEETLESLIQREQATRNRRYILRRLVTRLFVVKKQRALDTILAVAR